MKGLKYESDVAFELAELYKKHGYKRYKLGCFEEYSLYQNNKDFLIGKNVITFSDLSGRLMALRPDATLSVISHNEVPEDRIEKFFYNETVYRQATGERDYSEINQAGVEVVGAVDEASVAELTMLICDTLAAVSDNYVLDISHMGFTEGLLNRFPCERESLSLLLQKKNLHDFKALAAKCGFSSELSEAFEVAVNSFGDPQTVLKKVKSVNLNAEMKEAVDELERLVKRLDEFGYKGKVNLNFSVSNNADYYNGVVFNGYVEGVPHSVLSGGRYDKLLKKLGKKGGAIGFALYIGEIERYFKKDEDSVDCVILYDSKSQDDALLRAAEEIKAGNSVRLSLKVPENLNYGKIIDLVGRVK